MSSLGIFNKETKTYQKVAGTAEAAVLDAEMSDTSENPVQNKVIKKYVDEKQVKHGDGLVVTEDGTLKVSLDGTTLTMDQVNNVIKLADTLKGAIDGAFPAANVVNNLTTTEEGFALDARQANPNIDGTLAKQISDLNGSLDHINRVPLEEAFKLFADIPLLFGIHVFCISDIVGNHGPITDSPYPDAPGGWWNVISFGHAIRMTQITSQVFRGYKGENELWIRSKHDNNWSEWVKL